MGTRQSTQPSAAKELPKTEENCTGILGLELPPRLSTIDEALERLCKRNVRMDELASIIVSDPVISLEAMKVANALFFAADRPPITSIPNAIVRLGSQALTELLERLAARPALPEPIKAEFEQLRFYGQRVGAIARKLAQALHGDIADLAETAGLMTNYGLMLACAWLGERYVTTANGRHRASIIHRLNTECKFDVPRRQLTYLRLHGLPASVFFALDKELQCKSPGQSATRFVVDGALELVDAFDTEKFDRYAHYDKLPGKSSLRLLRWHDRQYETFYRECGGQLDQLLLARRKALAVAQTPVAEIPTASEAKPLEVVTFQLPELLPSPTSTTQIAKTVPAKEKTALEVLHAPTFLSDDIEGTDSSIFGKKKERAPMVEAIRALCERATSIHEIMKEALPAITSSGPFARAAVLEISQDRTSASILRAVGDGINAGTSISILDPLSPLSLCFTKLQSFNSVESANTSAPFGISAYGISPLRLDESRAIVIYVDCGRGHSFPFEARKSFRKVVRLLNRRLGGLTAAMND